MRNAIQKFRQSCIGFEKPGFLSKKLKIWRAPTTMELNIFCWNFAHVSYLPIFIKACSGFFFILFRSWVICKNKKRSGFYTLVFYVFIITTKDLNKILKNPEHAFVDIAK